MWFSYLIRNLRPVLILFVCATASRLSAQQVNVGGSFSAGSLSATQAQWIGPPQPSLLIQSVRFGSGRLPPADPAQGPGLQRSRREQEENRTTRLPPVESQGPASPSGPAPAAPADAIGIPPGTNGNGAQPQKAAGDAATAEKPLGEAPEKVNEVFLRQSTVLLKPGEGQIDLGLTYNWQESFLPVELSNGQLVNERLRSRDFLIPFTVRYGVEERTEVFARLPVGFATFERANIAEDSMTTGGGTGDLNLGAKHLFQEEKGECPDVIGTLALTAPLGSHPFHQADDVASLGNGFWAVSTGVNMVKSFDPAIVFGGLTYTHQFAREFGSLEIEPGETFEYSFGMGFAINESLVLSTQFLGALQTYTYANDARIPTTLIEPMSIRMGLTRVICKDRFLEPFVLFGLNSDAPNAQIGLLSTWGFGCERACSSASE